MRELAKDLGLRNLAQAFTGHLCMFIPVFPIYTCRVQTSEDDSRGSEGLERCIHSGVRSPEGCCKQHTPLLSQQGQIQMWPKQLSWVAQTFIVESRNLGGNGVVISVCREKVTEVSSAFSNDKNCARRRRYGTLERDGPVR